MLNQIPPNPCPLPTRLWLQLRKVLPNERRKRLGGRPRISNRLMMEAILLVFNGYGQWDLLDTIGPVRRSTAHNCFMRWRAAGVFNRIADLNIKYTDRNGNSWEWLNYLDEIVPDLFVDQDPPLDKIS